MIVNALIVVASFLVVLGLIVFIHELGHYSVAKFFGTKIERFSVGFGKPIKEWRTKSGEAWSIARIPLGGYVKFAGDSSAASSVNEVALDKAAREHGASALYQNKPVGQRALIAAAGPAANFILAILIFAGLAWGRGDTYLQPVIMDVLADSAAEAAGIEAGDRVLRLDGREISRVSELQSYIALRSGETIAVDVDRGGRDVSMTVVPRKIVREDAIGGASALGTIGVNLGGADNLVSQSYGPFEALGVGTQRVGESIAMTGTYVKRIFTGKEDGKQLGGVLRIAAITGKVAVDSKNAGGATVEQISIGRRVVGTTLSLLTLMAMLSIGLGIANLLPIPTLDGGHLVFYAYEALAGRPMSIEAQNIGYRLGLAVLVGLFVILTFNDVGYIRSLLS